MSEVRESVYQTLADIPEIIASAEEYIKIYRVHPARSLKKTTAALFEAILRSLRLIVKYFGKGSLGKASERPDTLILLTSGD